MAEPDRYQLEKGKIELNSNRMKKKMTVVNTGDRAVQVGSHYHFFEANRALKFDRVGALGMHLDLPAGTAVRFEPGDTHEVQLCSYGGLGYLVGFSGLVQGGIRGRDNRARAIRRLHKLNFLDTGESEDEGFEGERRRGKRKGAKSRSAKGKTRKGAR